jgi:hypothetical protein
MFEAASEGARRWVWLVACLWLVVAVGRTVGSTAAWQDSESLWLDSIRKYPQHTIAYHNLASHRMNVGRRSDAIQVLSMQLEREPANAGGWHAIAALLLKDGQAEVLTACSRALLLSADPATLKLSRQIAARSWEGDPAVDKLRFWLLQRLYRSGRILDARDLAAHYGTPKSAREQLLRQRIDSAGSATDD